MDWTGLWSQPRYPSPISLLIRSLFSGGPQLNSITAKRSSIFAGHRDYILYRADWISLSPPSWASQIAGLWLAGYFGIEYLGQEEDSHYTDPYIIKPSASRLIVYLQLARPTPSGEAAAADLFVVCFDGWCLLAGWALLLFLFLRKTIVLGAPRAFTILLLWCC